MVVWNWICLRIDSTEAWERRKRLVKALSSRNKPSSRCSVSIYGEPNWLASYRAKKITRLAFSVYRSNIFPSPRCLQSPLPETSFSLSGVRTRISPERSFPSSPAATVTDGPACCAGQTTICRNPADKNLNPVPFAPSLIQRSGQYLFGQSVMQPQNAITTTGKFKVVGDDEGCEPVVLMKSLHQSKHHFRGPVVQVTGRLIGHQYPGSRDQGPGQCHTLLLASGKLSGTMMTAVFQSNFTQPPGSFLHCLPIRG